MFSPCMSIAWRDVKSEFQILNMVPHKLKEGTFDAYVVFSEPLTENDTSRLRIYGEFVKKIYILSSPSWRLRKFDSLVSCAKSRAFLPNLETLVTHRPHYYREAELHLSLFVSSSLVNFRYEYEDGSLVHLCNSPAWWLVLHTVADKCPRISSLSFLPVDDDEHGETEEVKYSEDIPEPSEVRIPNVKVCGLCPEFGRFKSLTSLHKDMLVLESFPSGGLSGLVSLDVDLEWKRQDETSIYHGLFPLLTHLGLYCCYQRDLTQLVSGADTTLTALCLNSRAYKYLVGPNMLYLTRNYHTFSSLVLHADTDRSDDLLAVESEDLTPPAAISRLRRLRLQKIQTILAEGLPVDQALWTALPPTVSILEIPSQKLKFRQLSGFVIHASFVEELEIGLVGINDLREPNIYGNYGLTYRLNSLRINLEGQLTTTAYGRMLGLNNPEIEAIAEQV